MNPFNLGINFNSVLQVNFKLFIFILSLFVLACGKDESLPSPNLGQDYFPLKSGTSIIYQVDSITYNDFYTPVKIDSFSFFIRFDIDSSFIDNESRQSFYWRKYYRNDSIPWQLVKNYSLTLTSQRAETYEENVRYIKLVFPINNAISWNMNAMNVFDATSSYYEDFDIPMTIGTLNFDSTTTVIHQNLETLIGKNFYKEVYAKHLGLISRQQISIEKQANGLWKNGYSVSYKIQSFSLGK